MSYAHMCITFVLANSQLSAPLRLALPFALEKVAPRSTSVSFLNGDTGHLTPKAHFLFGCAMCGYVYELQAGTIMRPCSYHFYPHSHLDHSANSLKRLKSTEQASYAPGDGAKGEPPHGCMEDMCAQIGPSADLSSRFHYSEGLRVPGNRKN